MSCGVGPRAGWQGGAVCAVRSGNYHQQPVVTEPGGRREADVVARAVVQHARRDSHRRAGIEGPAEPFRRCRLMGTVTVASPVPPSSYAD